MQAFEREKGACRGDLQDVMTADEKSTVVPKEKSRVAKAMVRLATSRDIWTGEASNVHSC
jgi:hypothetical protein